jgi:hypothetical protein
MAAGRAEGGEKTGHGSRERSRRSSCHRSQRRATEAGSSERRQRSRPAVEGERDKQSGDGTSEHAAHAPAGDDQG